MRASSISTPIKTPFQLGIFRETLLIHQPRQSKYISWVLLILYPTIPQLASLRSDPVPHKCTNDQLLQTLHSQKAILDSLPGGCMRLHICGGLRRMIMNASTTNPIMHYMLLLSVMQGL
jgi:hypothetical protein